ncbi:MAG: sulfatase family protein [Candidatus Helarchaeota archaeon]
MKQKPNIILFITHDQGQSINIYNSPINPVSIKTPNLNKIAKKGIRFTNHFCTAPQCSPSRASIQTGKYPHQHGVMGLINEGWDLDTRFSIPIFFNSIGYSTHLIGFQHEIKNPKKLGYQNISKRKFVFGYSCSFMEDEYFKVLDECKDADKPFFLNIGVPECHRPFQIFGEPININSIKVPPYLPDTKPVKKELSEFFGTVLEVDKTVGKLYNRLKKLGIHKNTLFIFTTDHGIDMPRAKCTLYDPGLKTSLIMYWPESDLFSGGKQINSLVSNIDLISSLIDLFGNSKLNVNLEGKSFIPLLTGESNKIRNEIFAEKTYHVIYDPMRCIRTNDFKYIRNFDGSEEPYYRYQIPNDTFSYKSRLSVEKEHLGLKPKEELYDLINDPLEKNNLIKNPKYKSIANKLRSKLQNWMIETNDPILNGTIYPPLRFLKQHKKVFNKLLKKDFMLLFEHLINHKTFRYSVKNLMKYLV